VVWPDGWVCIVLVLSSDGAHMWHVCLIWMVRTYVTTTEAEGAQLGSEEIEGQLTDPRHSKFSRKVPLNELIEVLDVLWQSEDTL